MSPNLLQRIAGPQGISKLRVLIDRRAQSTNCPGTLWWVQSRAKSDTALEKSHKTTQNLDVPEEEFTLYNFNKVEIVPEEPIKSLDIESRIEKIAKKGSFSVDLFSGKYDHDFLTYPDTLKDKHENKALQDQATMVKQLWPQIWQDPMLLHQYNFHNLYQLSVTEMMTVFEAIGASTRGCFETKLSEMNDAIDRRQAACAEVTRAVISLITRNCLTCWPIKKFGNDHLKQLLTSKDIKFGPPEHSDNVRPPIGFCWTEQGMGLGSLPPQEWQTVGAHGADPPDHVSIKGTKHRVLHDESVTDYLVFYRDYILSEKYQENMKNDESNPSVDPFMGCCLVNATELKPGPLYTDSAGIEYFDIEIDVIVPPTRVLFKPDRLKPAGLNIKALGQLATCSVMLGMLKDSLRRTYRYLLNHKEGLLTCDIVQRILTLITSRIFALESMTYYIAGMYDGLQDGFDAHLEATILKVATSEYSFEIIQNLQKICGSDMFMTSQVQDLANVFDSFLDGNIHNRLYLSTLGVAWFARGENKHLNQLRLAPWYPGYFIKHTIKAMAERGNYLTLSTDVYGNLHPSLKEAAENLEYILKRVKHAVELMCMKHGGDVTSAQSALYALSQLSMDAFILTTICARASKSYCNGTRNSDLDVMLATSYSFELAKRVKQYIEDLRTTPLVMTEARSDLVNELNLKYGGYYAESPLQPNI